MHVNLIRFCKACFTKSDTTSESEILYSLRFCKACFTKSDTTLRSEILHSLRFCKACFTKSDTILRNLKALNRLPISQDLGSRAEK